MALQLGVSRLCTLLLWGCICFPPQKGYNIAHGYSLNDDDFSSHAGVFGPQTSNQFHSGASLNPNQDSVSPRDEMQAMIHQSFQREPVQHENNKDASLVSLSEEMIKSKPESEHAVPSSPPVLKKDNEGFGYQHPFGLLVKAHTKGKNTAGTSFSSIKDFKRFIESLKTSFLIPGSDVGRHFQTARETIENEIASNAQNVNNNGQHDTGYRSSSAKEGTAHDDASGNEDWSDAMNTAIEQGEQGTNYQKPSESLFVPDPVDSTASLISPRVYDGRGSALYPLHNLAATEHVSRNYGGFDSGGISGENPVIFTSAPHVRNKAVQSTSSKFPKQIPSGSFFGDDLSFSGHVTASPVDPRNSPSQDFSHYSGKDLTSKKTIQHRPKYTFYSKDSLTWDQKLSGGLELGKDVQSQELSRVTPANILSAAMPSSLNSGHVLYAPRDQLYIPDYQPEHNQRPAKSSPTHQPTVGRQSNDINHMPTAHLPVSTGSVSSSSNNPSPQSSSVLVGPQTSSPHDAQNVAFNRKKPVGFFTRFTGQPSGSPDGSSRHGGHLQDKTVRVSPKSVYTHRVKSRNGYVRSKVSLTRNSYEPLSAGCIQEH
ncbi:uncharacterized protein LOC116394679 [Anarrhichthys ocellatus]|uniref:uncharacterized protein LOC116394679 n=1 Tax=Anarrhichthys ocellatus TaxID=433405 RepID=UPI0012ED8E92|nr:uncharacterized protein LOC116394679 [Anarrhichthys ocellatus]